MPEDPYSRPEATASSETRNLPVLVQRPSEVARDHGESWIGRALRVLFGWKPTSIRADLEVVLETAAAGESGFSPEERKLLKNILGLRECRIVDVMVPRADIVAVQQDIPLGELVKVFENAGHSRVVAYDDTLDDPVGVVHIRDLIAYMATHAAVDPEKNAKRRKPFVGGLDLKTIDLAIPLSKSKIIRSLLFVPPSMPAMDLLVKMQASRMHLALVIDEYGGTDGLVSMEDLVEQIVGEIEDEHDEYVPAAVTPQPDGSFLADARASLEDVTATVGHEFDVGEMAEEVDTLGGYIAMRIGRVPTRGELVPGPDTFEIEILDADPRRVKKLRIYRTANREARNGHDPAAPTDTPSAAPAETPLVPTDNATEQKPDEPPRATDAEPRAAPRP